jgi:hypothetical protein
LEQANIDRLLTARKITEDWEQFPAGEDAVWDFIKKLQSLGFNTLKQFYQWNHEMNKAALAECVIVDSKCDHCKGYPNEPPCYKTFTKDSGEYVYNCFEDKSDKEKHRLHLVIFDEYQKMDRLRDALLKKIELGFAFIDIDRTKERWGIVDCPPGHGYVLDPNKQKDLPFDISWHR